MKNHFTTLRLLHDAKTGRLHKLGSTWLQSEEYAYPNGAMRRLGRAYLDPNPHNPITLPYGELRRVYAGIPDTYFSVPAKVRSKRNTIHGFVSVKNDRYVFTPDADPDHCTVCKPGEGCKS